jgi:hypothetical protein
VARGSRRSAGVRAARGASGLWSGGLVGGAGVWIACGAGGSRRGRASLGARWLRRQQRAGVRKLAACAGAGRGEQACERRSGARAEASGPERAVARRVDPGT